MGSGRDEPPVLRPCVLPAVPKSGRAEKKTVAEKERDSGVHQPADPADTERDQDSVVVDIVEDVEVGGEAADPSDDLQTIQVTIQRKTRTFLNLSR